MRLWDLRTAVCQGVLVAPGPVAATFDHQGLVFAAASHCGLVKMYDVRAYDKGPFQTVVVVDESNSPLAFSDIKFSPDGKMLLAGLEGRTYVLDSFSGSQLARLATPFSPGSLAMEASFSADSKYVLQGCASDNSVRVWAVPSGTEVASLTGHAAAPTCVKWAPRRALVASACHALVLWIPNLAALQQQAAGAAMQIDGHSR